MNTKCQRAFSFDELKPVLLPRTSLSIIYCSYQLAVFWVINIYISCTAFIDHLSNYHSWLVLFNVNNKVPLVTCLVFQFPTVTSNCHCKTSMIGSTKQVYRVALRSLLTTLRKPINTAIELNKTCSNLNILFCHLSAFLVRCPSSPHSYSLNNKHHNKPVRRRKWITAPLSLSNWTSQCAWMPEEDLLSFIGFFSTHLYTL